MGEYSIKKINSERRRLPAREYIRKFRDRPVFEELCKECPNYGKRWGCPPFDDSQPYPDIEKYEWVELVLIRIDLQWEKDTYDRQLLSGLLSEIIRVQRRQWEPLLLEEENRLKSFAALFTGMCPYCIDKECSRIHGSPCRHRSRVRPSLESLGFNLQTTAKEIFNTDILWSATIPPAYLVMMGAVFS